MTNCGDMRGGIPHLAIVRSDDNDDDSLDSGDSDLVTTESTNLTEQATIAAIRAGNKTALDALYLATYDNLIAFATRYLHSGAAAEDIVQEVFLAIWRARDSWAPSTSIRAYLFTAVRNRALKQIRHLQITDATLASGALQMLTPSPVRPDEVVEANDRTTRIRETVNALPERQSTALMLRWHRGLAYPEIAMVLGVSPQAARTLVLRAQDRLKSLLEDDL